MSYDMDMTYVSEVMRTMYNFSVNKQFTNFKIRVGEKTAHVHQSVICSKSDFFQAICLSGNTEAVIKNVKAEDEDILSAVVKFLYFGQTTITIQNVEPLALSADVIKNQELKAQCETYMINNLTLTKLKSYSDLAQRTGLQRLKDECLRFSKEHFSDVSQTDWFTGLSIEEIEVLYLQADDLNAPDEYDVLQAVLRWLENSHATPAGKESYMERLFPCLRLSFCSRSQLDALRKEEKISRTLKLGLLEYLHEGMHRDHKPRRYTEIPAPETEAERPSRGTDKPATPSGKPTSMRAEAVTAASKIHAIPSANPRPPTLPTATPGTSSGTHHVDRKEDHIIIVGGKKAGNIYHKDVISLENHPGDHSKPLTQLPSYNFSLTATNDALLVSGGNDFTTRTSVSLVWKYCFNTRSWITLPKMLKPLTCHGSACVDEKLYTIGGRYDEKGEIKKYYNTVSMLDLTSMKWSECKKMAIAVCEPGITVVDECIFVIGEHTGKEWSEEVRKYNTRADTIQRCQRLPKSGSFYRSTVVVNRHIYVLDNDVFLRYAVDQDVWTELTIPMKPSCCCSMVLYQGRLLVTGGYEENYKEPNDRVQVYDIGQNTWIMEKYTMPLPLLWHWTVVAKLPTSK